MARDQTFLLNMSDLGFVEELRGLFRSHAVWSEAVGRHLALTFGSDFHQ